MSHIYDLINLGAVTDFQTGLKEELDADITSGTPPHTVNNTHYGPVITDQITSHTTSATSVDLAEYWKFKTGNTESLTVGPYHETRVQQLVSYKEWHDGSPKRRINFNREDGSGTPGFEVFDDEKIAGVKYGITYEDNGMTHFLSEEGINFTDPRFNFSDTTDYQQHKRWSAFRGYSVCITPDWTNKPAFCLFDRTNYTFNGIPFRVFPTPGSTTKSFTVNHASAEFDNINVIIRPSSHGSVIFGPHGVYPHGNYYSTHGHLGHTLFHRAKHEGVADGDWANEKYRLLSWTGNPSIIDVDGNDDAVEYTSWTNATEVNATSSVHFSSGAEDKAVAGILVHGNDTTDTEIMYHSGHLTHSYPHPSGTNSCKFASRGDSLAWCISEYATTNTVPDSTVQAFSTAFFYPKSSQLQVGIADGDVISSVTDYGTNNTPTYSLNPNFAGEWIQTLCNNQPGMTLNDSVIWESDAQDMTGDFAVTMFLYTPTSWSLTYHTFFRTESAYWTYSYNNISNLSTSWSSGITLNNSAYYLLTFIYNRTGGEVKVRVNDGNGWTEYDQSNPTIPTSTGLDDIWFFSGAVSGSGVWNLGGSGDNGGKAGAAIVYPYSSSNVSSVESWFQERYDFNCVNYAGAGGQSLLETGCLISSSSINGYCHKAPDNIHRAYTVGKFIGQETDFTNQSHINRFTNKTISDGGKTYTCLLIPIHLNLT